MIIAKPALLTNLPGWHANVFLVFAGVCFVGSLVVLRYLPETKNKSLEEIERSLVFCQG